MSSLLAVVALAGCAGCGDLGSMRSCAIRGELAVGPGIVLVQPGTLYGGEVRYAAEIGPDGRFRLELPDGGTHGLMLVVGEGYLYLPIEVEVGCDADTVVAARDGRALTASDDADLGDNPVLTAPRVTVGPAGQAVSVDAADPDGDLWRVFAHPVGSSIARPLTPPTDIVDEISPDGRYTGAGGLDAAAWLLVAMDHSCSTSDVLRVEPTTE